MNLSYIPAGNVIQLYSLRCHCSKCFNRFDQDTIVDCTAYVNTKSGREVPVTVQYCSGCGSFFMNYDMFVGYQAKYGALRFECKLEQSEFKDYDDFGFADTSFLSRAGYSVRASVSQRRRQIILKELLDSGKYTKWEITEKILLMCLSRVFYRFFDFLLEKGRIKLNPQQLWIFEKTI